MTRRLSTVSAALLAALTYSSADAALINFETTPGGGTPTDDALLNTPYVEGNLAITFGSDTDGDGGIDIFAHFEDRNNGVGQEPGNGGHATDKVHGYTHGIGAEAYYYDHDATPGKVGGDWMIRNEKAEDYNGTGTEANQLLHPFVIVYTTANPLDLPVSASGQIWDIDSNAEGQQKYPERYKATAFDINGNELASQLSDVGLPYTNANSLSGKPWTFSFDNLGAGIARIEIVQTQTAGRPRGIAFDNFDATQPAGGDPVPEPASAAVLGLALTALAGRRRQR